jgi:serine/threonine protein kinase
MQDNPPIQTKDMTSADIDKKPLDIREGITLAKRYLLEKRIGGGGMGVVFKARDLLITNPEKSFVAIKTIGKAFKNHPRAMQAFEEEALRTQELHKHDNIISVWSYEKDDAYDVYFIKMEYLSGYPLSQLMKGNPIDISKTYSIIKDISNALIYAHSKNIIHSDIKPSNIFITDNNEIKVIDFGIARIVRDHYKPSQINISASDEFNAYTLDYASCEVLERLPKNWEPDSRDDIYALACIAYELFTGEKPFGSNKGAREARDEGLTLKPVKVLSEKQWKALKQGLEFARKDRTKSVEKFLDEIIPKCDVPQAGNAKGGIVKKEAKRDLMLFGSLLLVIAVILVIIFKNLFEININENGNEHPNVIYETPTKKRVCQNYSENEKDYAGCQFGDTAPPPNYNPQYANFKEATGLPSWIINGLDDNGVYSQPILVEAIRNGFRELKGAYLSKANLHGVDLSHTDMRGAYLEEANLCDTNYASAKLDGANLNMAIDCNGKCGPGSIGKCQLMNK